jgi:peptidyl-prolyl cis-trans isomerase SurA
MLLLRRTLASFAVAFTLSHAASATVVERVVAVVGEKAILLSDVRERARPFLVRINEEIPTGAQRSAAISQTYKNVLERMVDEELEQRAANRSKIQVDAREVDEAITRIASQNGISVDQLVNEALRSGLDRRQYRQEIRRQVLEAKLLNLRVQGRIRVSEEDVRGAYRRLVMDERKKLDIHVAWIRIDVPPGDRVALKAARERAEKLAVEARSSGNFADLARQNSDDVRTRDKGGDLGTIRPGSLSPAIDQALAALEPGQISGAVRASDSIFVLRLVGRQETELPSFDESKNELAERVYLEKMAKARRVWLDGLRRSTYVKVRM